MIKRVKHGGLQIASELNDLLSNEILDGLDIGPSDFWASFQEIFEEFLPRNNTLLRKREDIQTKIDQWHIENRENTFDLEVYKDFLKDIGYLLNEGEDFKIRTSRVDPEISNIAGPQLVVPVMNARFALNAANARWGSL